MAEEVEMTPVDAVEPPKANPLAKPTVPSGKTIPLNPVARKPLGGATVSALRPGLKLPPKPGATVSALRPGVKLPPKTTPTASIIRPGLKLPTKPVIRKPGATIAAMPLPKPVTPVKPVTPTAVEPPKPVEPTPTPAPATPVAVEPPKPTPAVAKPVPPPVVEAPKAETPTPTSTPAPAVAAAEAPKPLETLKSVTQKLKGVTQAIPQQAILRKTGIIAETEMSTAQKEAAKHKTARISLSDAMGVAPVKNDAAPMKTIRIKRPIDIPGATKPLHPAVKPANLTPPSAAKDDSEVPTLASPELDTAATTVQSAAPKAPESEASVTQRKTLKIARPSGAVRPAGKFGIKRPTHTAAPTAAAPAEGEAAPAADASVSEIADIPDIPTMPVAPTVAAPASDGPAWLFAISALVQIAACAVIGALAWFLYQNTQVAYF